MDILSQIPALVKWRDKKRANLLIADKLQDAGYQLRGARVRLCGTALFLKTCPDCGKSFVSSANLCRDRLCPTCEWRLSMRRFAEMCAVMQYISDDEFVDAGFLTLTVRNCEPGELRATLQQMAKDWNRMLQLRGLKRMVCGWARSLEITYNAKTRTFHPHYHVIILTRAQKSTGELQKAFRAAWARACRLDYEPITDYREIRAADKDGGTNIDNDKFAAAICETYKYAVKSDDMRDMPLSDFRALVSAIAGLRFAAFGGIIKDARRALSFKEETDDNEKEIDRDICDCGAKLTTEILRWSMRRNEYVRFSELI